MVYGTNNEGMTGYRSDPISKNQDKAPKEYPPTPEYLFSDAAANDSDTAEKNEGAAVKKAKPQMKNYPVNYEPRRATLKHEMMVYVPETSKPCTVCFCFDCLFMAYIQSYNPRLHLRSPIALQREHAC